MARIRTVKPDFFKNDQLAELPPLTRILFQGLWCLADCEGRLDDRPKRIKAEVLPYDEWDVDEALSDLHKNGFIERYQVSTRRLIQVTNFLKHQRITGSEADSASTLPAPPANEDGRREVVNGDGAANVGTVSTGFASGTTDKRCDDEATRKHSGNTQETLRKHSGNTQDDRKGKEGKGKEGGSPAGAGAAKKSKQTSKPKERDELFDAVCEVTATDPKASGSYVGRVCKSLRSAEPPYTPEEVRKWGKQIRAEGWCKGAPTLGMLEQRIGIVRQPQEDVYAKYGICDPDNFPGRDLTPEEEILYFGKAISA